MKKLQLLMACLFMLLMPLAVKAQSGPSVGGGNGANENEGNPLFDNKMPNILPAEPKVAELMRFDEIKLNEYTGIPNIGYDIYNANVAGNVNIGISLSYDVSALSLLRKNELYGVGWILNGRAAISRTVVGSPDDQVDTIVTPINTGLNSGSNLKMIGLLMPGNNIYAYNGQPLPGELTWNALHHPDEKLDKDPDVFQLSLMGYSQKFNLIKDPNDLTQIIPVINGEEQYLKIEPIRADASSPITSFKVTTPDSYVFYFEETGTTSAKTITNSVLYSGSMTGSISDNYTAITSWSLTRIENASGELLATYSYVENTDKKIDVSRSKTINRVDLNTVTIPSPPSSPGSSTTNDHLGVLPPKQTISTNILSFNSKELSEIDIIGKEKIKFYYNPFTSNYKDENNTTQQLLIPYLSQVVVEDYSGAAKFTYDFTYDFPPVPSNLDIEEAFPNFFLTSISKNGLTTSFAYNNKDELPHYLGKKHNQNFYMRDKWGFYNGDKSQLPSIYHTMVDKDKIKTGVLTHITKPTGGKVEYVWEANTFSYIGDELVDPKDIPENYSYNTGVGTNFHTVLNSGCMTPAANTQTFTTSGGPISYSADIIVAPYGTPDPSNPLESTGNYQTMLPVYEIRLVNTSTGEDFSIALGTLSTANAHNAGVLNAIPAGTYTVSLNMLQSSLNDLPCQLAVNFSLLPPTYQLDYRYMTGGGLRINQIRHLDTDNTLQDYRKYTYHDVDYEVIDDGIGPIPDPPLSFGSFDGMLENKKYPAFKTVLAQATEVGVNYETEIINYHQVDVTNTAGSMVGYEQVAVARENLGYEVKTFISPKDVPLHQDYINNTPQAYYDYPKTDLDYTRGKLLTHNVFDKDHKLLKRVNNEYQSLNVNSYGLRSIMEGISGNDCPYTVFYREYSDFQYPHTPDPVLWQNSGLTESQIISGTGNCSGGMSEDLNTYTISSGKHYLSKSTSNEYFYDGTENLDADGVPIPNRIVELISESDIYTENGQPKTQIVTTNQNDSSETQTVNYYYPTNPNDFDQSLFSAGQLQNIQGLVGIHNINQPVYQVTEQNGKSVTTVTNFEFYNSTKILPNKTIVYKDTNEPASTIYFNRYDDRYNVLEASTQSTAMLINGPNYDDAKVVSYIYGYGNSKPIAKLVGVRYQDIENLPATDSQFSSYIEQLQNLSNNDFGNWINSNQSEQLLRNALDELRVFFPEAYITTITYDPLRGSTTVTDPRGITMYYDYDGLSRLRLVLDHNFNTVEHYSYNYGQ